MIRDPGPIHNIGHGVTSRDVPFNEDETEGIAPNSGYISRALDSHPIMKFVASTATTMVVAGILSRMTKQGGLKLGKFLESKPESEIATRAVNTAKQIRKMMDEFQGVKRYVDGVDDPYSKLVFEQEGKLSTGYDGVKSERFGYDFMTAEERRLAGAGLLHEPPVKWTARDALQQRLVRAGRRLPYELPAFYLGQKAVVDPLFGRREQTDKKVRWYNPADVISDFTVESVKNIATMILPAEMIGAGASAAKHSLHNTKFGAADIRDMPGLQQKMHKGFVEVSDLLAEVGHDFASITNKILNKTNQSIGAFSAASDAYRNRNGVVQAYHKLRKGYESHIASERARAASGEAVKNVRFDALFKGAGQFDDEYSTILDLVPSFSGMRASLKAGKEEYKSLGYARKAIDNAIEFDRVLHSHFGGDRDKLLRSINKIQSQHKSRLSELARGVEIQGRGGPESYSFSKGQFSRGQQADAFKDLLELQLIEKGIDRKNAKQFVQHLRVKSQEDDITKIITIGKTQILEDGADAGSASRNFFGQVITRYKGIAGGEDVPGLTDDALEDAVRRARDTFTSREFKRSLDNKIKNNWNKFYRDDLHRIAGSVLKPKKALYQDFVGGKTDAKLEFLQRKTAETLGVKLIKTDGAIKSTEEILGELRRRGFNPDNFTDLRAFLIKNKKITSGIFEGGQNLFGLQQVSIDEAVDKGLFKYLPENQQNIISDISKRMAISDPVSRSIGLSRLDGVYKTKSGEILDFTSIKSTFSKLGDFFASEFKIPILGFNPADLFGYNSFAEMSRRAPLQYVSSRSVQPFLGEAAEGATKPSFYMFYRDKGTKGRLIEYRANQASQSPISVDLPGRFRAVPSASADLISRHTRYGAASEGLSPEEIVSGELTRKSRFKRFFDIDSEQPNSIFGLLGRFRRRTSDPNNMATMARLLKGEEVIHTSGRTKRRVRLDISESKPRVIDEFGEVVPEITEKDILRGAARIAKEAFQYGTPTNLMKELEDIAPEIYSFAGRRVSRVQSIGEAVDLAKMLIEQESTIAGRADAMGVDPVPLLTSLSRVKALLNLSNLNSTSMMSKKSPTISTRFDELKNEMFRYISQTNQMLNPSAMGRDPFLLVQEAIQNLVKSGKMSMSQAIEAQAAGLATLANTSAFKTYVGSDSNIESVRKAFLEFFNTFSSNPEAKKFLDPFSEGEIAQVGSAIRKRFSPILSAVKRKLGTAGYTPNDLAIDPLGSGQGVTLLPTFSTSAARRITTEDGTEKSNFFGTLKNALGFDTYSNPNTFSSASIPISQSIERLNRYFGTLGTQLDVSKFKGPLDLYMRGMVGKRVLPLYIAGTTAMTVDRTMGGMVNERDQRGERVYSPLVIGNVAKAGVEIQSVAAGLIPGGMTYEEKKEQLVEGEVPIRQGRYWPLGNTPFKGGKIMYYRPSWYRKLQGGALFTEDTYGSPLEKLLFYNDTSPLRPLDPYRFERKHYYDRPYPVSGEYFSGPFGPAVPLANMTIGKLLKPSVSMHEDEVRQGLMNYVPAGQFGAYDSSAYSGLPSGPIGSASTMPTGAGASLPAYSPFAPNAGIQSSTNAMLASRTGFLNTASNDVTNRISTVNSGYTGAAFGPPKVSGVMNPRIVPSGQPISSGGTEFQLSELGYRTQEMLGIYGFATGTLREKFGFGQSDFEPQRAVLQSASKAYGTSRAFWDLNLGGLGDVPISGAEGIGNIEFSEIVRRFIPKDRTNVDYINPISNTMGKQYPFLPGAEYYTNFKTGDPYTKVQEGELRLPGIAYERFNPLSPDEGGRYGLVDQLNILGDVAPYSKQFKSIAKKLGTADLSAEERIRVQDILQQAEDTTTKREFSEYEYKDVSAKDLAIHPIRYGINRIGEYIAHSDNFIANKAFGKKTALEDWERNNVYGTTFPQWSNPIEGYIEPMLNKATQKNPIVAAAGLGAVGALFGRTPRARLFGTSVGIGAGLVSSTVGQAYELVTGDQFIPRERKKELALEEYSDILSYVKNTRLAALAEKQGDAGEAYRYRMASKRTMYGADIYSGDVETLSLAIPKRKREHFKAMINAPTADRPKILQTAGRLERRIYQAAWGMDVEDRPDLAEYFTKHELPSEEWEGWHPNTNNDHIKIKTSQSMGLDLSQMGYYPQQIKEANLVNPSYPSFFDSNDSTDMAVQLRRLMSGMGINGSVSSSNNPFGRDQFNINAGVR